ncbi:rhox homeobox family member 1-like [Fukomys damarensis]|uniref:rhox homeobox family member 1-like n=1 Tax=Fukomys damarensis TaxID=885580 RepID=UPI0014558E56|nr:rhox homeobox family member 1-like [Fukomys damarensis]
MGCGVSVTNCNLRPAILTPHCFPETRLLPSVVWWRLSGSWYIEAKETQCYYYYSRYFGLEFSAMEARARPALGVPEAAQCVYFGEGVLGLLELDEGHEGHPGQAANYCPLQVVNVSQRGDADRPVNQGQHLQPVHQLPLAQQDPFVAMNQSGYQWQPRFRFTEWQVQELERVFQETQYPSVITRMVLARDLNVPESKVQNWFNYRRAKYRKMLRNQC